MLWPKAFGVFQPFLDYAQKRHVGNFHLVVSLGVSWGREVVLDSEFCIEFLILGIIELLSVVGDDDSGNLEQIDDRLPSEVTDVLLSEFRQGFNLHPLGEVVNGHCQEPHLSFSVGKWPDYIDSPLGSG